MSVLITGAGGFLGTHLVQAFAADLPDATIHATDLIAPPADFPRIVAHALDVADAAAVSDFVARIRPRLVVHAAAITPSPAVEAADAPRIVAVNIGGAVNVLHAALTSAGVARTVLISSAAVYGNAADLPDPLSETTWPAPATLYGIGKLAAEDIGRRLATLHHRSFVAVRLTSLYGRAERPSAHRLRMSEIHTLRHALQHGQAVATAATDTLRDWTDADDAAEAICRLAVAPRLHHDVYNIGAGHSLTWAETLAVFVRQGLRILPPGSADAQAITPPTRRPPLAIDRLLADTGFRPTRRLAA